MSAVLVMGAFVAVAAVMVSWSSQLPREFVGQRVDVSRVNRLEYRDVDETATRERREEARKAAPLVYTANTDYLDRMRGEIEALPLLLRDKPTLAEVPATVVERYGLGEASFRALKELDQTDELDQWKRWTDRMVANLTTGVPLVAPAEFEAYSTAARRMVVIPPRADLPGDRARSSTLGRGAIELRADDPAPMRARLVAEATEAGFPMELARVSVGPILAEPRATVAFDSGATKIAADDAADAVAPTVRIHARGETVFTPGDTLTTEQVAMAADEQHRNSEARGTTGYLGSLAEAGALALALALLLSVYLAEHEPALFRNWQRLAALLAIALLPLALTAPVSSIFPRALLFCLVGSGLLATGVITIVFGLRVSLLAILLQGVLAIFALHPPAGVFLATLASSVAFAIALRDVRHRSTLVTAALASGAAAGIAVILAGISNGAANGDSAIPMLGDALVSVVTAFFVGFLVIGLLSTIERLFSVTTGLTLGELRDPKQPLLRELQRRAPGTWNHSLQVANIAEAAAESIGADGLLTYVGALYHDIGKVNKPEYFVENQTGINRHERLSPAMSLLVIVGHVKDGMELAAEYRLPRSVRHFIESHHGTTLMEYFFHAAQRKAGDDELNEADFRYPGPKPRTREAAVMMLCDCVESASRTLSEPTPARIEQLVRDLSHKRLVDGQFDDSPLTLRELRSVEDSVIKSLNAIYHGRISYPSARSDQRDQRGDQPMPRVAS